METMVSSWEVTGLLSEEADAPSVRVCNGVPVLGGPGIVDTTGTFSRTYEDLPTHTTIYVDIGIKLIGGWKDSQDTLRFIVDDETIATFLIEEVGATDGANSCDNSGEKDIDTRLVGKLSHSADSINFEFSWELTTEGASFAIHDVSLILSSDTTADSLVFMNLVDTSVSVDPAGNPTGETTCQTGSYWETNACVECNEACSDCFGSGDNECYQCATNYNFIDDKCQQCATDCSLCSAVASGNCLLCNAGFTLESDGTCTEDADSGHGCDSPYIYKYEDASCEATCSTPYVEEWQDKVGYFCNKPCSDGQFLLEDGECADECDSETHEEVETDGIDYCNAKSSSGSDCPTASGYIYPNSSCLTTCVSPYTITKGDTSSSCDPPCEDGQYYVLANKTCQDECKDGIGIISGGNGILYCQDFGKCNSTQFQYEDGLCKSSCPFPYKTNKTSTTTLCKTPCADSENKLYMYVNGTCNATCDHEEFHEVTKDNAYKVCEEICLLTLQSNGSYKTTCENSDKKCAASKFYFPDLSTEAKPVCESVCPAGFFTNKSAICISPCSLDEYVYADGTCLDYCKPGYLPKEDEGGFKYCNKGFLATIEMYVRYDISLSDWTTKNYGQNFTTMIAKLLGISESAITILKTSSGSTIVEAEAALTAGSTLTLKSKATAASESLNSASLKIGSTEVLNKNFNVVMDEIKDPEAKNIESEKSNGNTVAIAIGVGAGVVALGAVIVGLKVYRFKINQREAREIEANREINYRVKDVESTPIRTSSAVTSPNQSRNYQLSERRKLTTNRVY